MTTSAAELAHVLFPRVGPDLETLRTAQSLQRHQEWVSQESDEIPGLLRKVGFSLLGEVINPISTGGQAYVAIRDHQAVVAFRGSGGDNLRQTLLNSLADARVRRVKPREIVPIKGRSAVKVHVGFYENYLEFRDEIRRNVRSLDQHEVYVTGFSLGSALATLCALDLAVNENLNVTLHGMGTPRVGNRAFGELLEQKVPRVLRTALTGDPVTRVPLQIDSARSFHHAGHLLELQLDGSPVPLHDITGRLKDGYELGDHNRNKYASMIASLIEQLGNDPNLLEREWGERPLQKAAERERGPLFGSPEDDDDDE